VFVEVMRRTPRPPTESDATILKSSGAPTA
jgi:hypothetical protein